MFSPNTHIHTLIHGHPQVRQSCEQGAIHARCEAPHSSCKVPESGQEHGQSSELFSCCECQMDKDGQFRANPRFFGQVASY